VGVCVSCAQYREVVFWAPSSQVVLGRRQQRLGSLVMAEQHIKTLADEQAVPVLLKVRSGGWVMGGGGRKGRAQGEGM
jgi:hypothetical protein